MAHEEGNATEGDAGAEYSAERDFFTVEPGEGEDEDGACGEECLGDADLGGFEGDLLEPDAEEGAEECCEEDEAPEAQGEFELLGEEFDSFTDDEPEEEEDEACGHADHGAAER